MFIRDFVYIAKPFEVVAPQFLRDPGWLDPLVAAASGTSTGRCERGTARHHADSLVVPIRWVLEQPTARSLEGDLVIAPVALDECQIAFAAQLDTSDEAALRGRETRGAEAAIRAFLNSLADALTIATAPSAPDPR